MVSIAKSRTISGRARRKLNRVLSTKELTGVFSQKGVDRALVGKAVETEARRIAGWLSKRNVGEFEIGEAVRIVISRFWGMSTGEFIRYLRGT